MCTSFGNCNDTASAARNTATVYSMISEHDGRYSNRNGHDNLSNFFPTSDFTNATNIGSSGNWANEILFRLQEFSLSVLEDNTEKGPTYQVYFHLANVFLLFSYLSANTVYGLLCLRCAAVIACVLFALWSYYVLRSTEAVIWNLIFIAINVIHIIILLYKVRPICFRKEIEQLYTDVFKPLKVSRVQFKKLLKCMKETRQLKYQEIYAQEKITKVESVSVVLSGKFVISQQGKALHIVFPRQFLDSPEWFGVSTDDYFQVSITAIEESKILVWHRDKLRLSIMNDKFLQTVFDHIIGRDVVKKLIQVNEAVTASVNGCLSSNYNEEYEDNLSDKAMIIVKKSGESAGIAALLSRQLQVNDPDAWRLGKIEEADHETPV